MIGLLRGTGLPRTIAVHFRLLFNVSAISTLEHSLSEFCSSESCIKSLALCTCHSLGIEESVVVSNLSKDAEVELKMLAEEVLVLLEEAAIVLLAEAVLEEAAIVLLAEAVLEEAAIVLLAEAVLEEAAIVLLAEAILEEEVIVLLAEAVLALGIIFVTSTSFAAHLLRS